MQSCQIRSLIFLCSPLEILFLRGCACILVVFILFTMIGCGTTKWSDTSRTGTEQLLLTHAMDKAVEQVDFQALSGKKVTIDHKAIDSATDSQYLVSLIRQHLLASGAMIHDMEEADYVLELRAGAVGTDRNELFYGIPGFSIPTGMFGDATAGTTAIPAVAFIRITDQKAVVKVAMFAYNKHSNKAVWQSGSIPAESFVKAAWYFGSGPWLNGDLNDGTKLAGRKIPELSIPIIIDSESGAQSSIPELTVTQPAFFREKTDEVKTNTTETPPNAPAATPEPDFPNNATFLPQLIQPNGNQNFYMTPSGTQ